MALEEIFDQDKAKELLKEMDLPLEHPQFFSKLFTILTTSLKKKGIYEGNLYAKVCVEEYNQLSLHLDASKVQDSCSVRNVLKTRAIAQLLINEDGEIDFDALHRLLEEFRGHLYSLGPERQNDAFRQEHILRVLEALSERPEIRKLILSISRPYSHRNAEILIRETLQLSPKESLTDAHARRAALSAWMCFLRQSVGSCFGTAPAIIVQQEQYSLFLQDILDLLAKGRLSRVIAGEEFSVPISYSWGKGDLKRPVLIHKHELDQQAKLWWSPGLLSALKEVGVLDGGLSIAKRRAQLKDWIAEIVLEMSDFRGYCILTCDQILKLILMKHHQVTEAQLESAASHSHDVFSGPVMLSSIESHERKTGIKQFQDDYDKAQNTFVSLADNALLKAWEFTIASFAETKSTFTRWNLYSSLGLEYQEPRGIGETLYLSVKNSLDQANEEVRRLQEEYEVSYSYIKGLERRLRRASSEDEARWLNSDYRGRLYELQNLEEMRNEAHEKAQKFASMYQVMIEEYYRLFPQYFQEVYDADMHLAAGQYDDSPAGFRLLYKHGRTNSSLWSLIDNAEEFIESLASFFIATENDLIHLEDLKGLEKEVNQAISDIINLVRTEDFLTTAFYRMAKAHKTPLVKDPLNNLDKIEKKPWSYTSGGNVETLISGYYGREQKPSVEERWVENEMELLVFLVDTLKKLTYQEMEDYGKFPEKSFLMHSPTHAFLLKPFRDPFSHSWKTDAYTYIWVRDYFVQPRINFYNNLLLDESMLQSIVQGVAQELEPSESLQFKQLFRFLPKKMRPNEFRDFVERQMGRKMRFKTFSLDDLDAYMYTHLPLFPHYQLEDKLKRIVEDIGVFSEKEQVEMVKLFEFFPKIIGNVVIGSKQLREIICSLILLFKGRTSSPVNYADLVQRSMENLGYAAPRPIIFSDTNWVRGEFAFVVNPGTAKLEFWNLDQNGTLGFPMTAWEQWLNGSRRDIPWGVYYMPHEYVSK
ncbi:MAG: hypothetical protein Tsb0021_02350 [Chlamydiales bacterium]